MEKLYENGLENYPKRTVFLTNMLLLLWFGFAAYGMSKLTFAGLPIVSMLYLLFVTVMLGFVLRKHLCTHCYYYDRWCCTGWGKLSARLFKQESGNYGLGMKLAGITWGLLTIVPLIVIPLSMFLRKEFLVSGGVSLACFIVILAINQFGRKRGCSQCKMRYICEGSAAK